MLTNLALVLRDYYIRTGNPDDLTEAITHSERACRESESIGCRVMLGDLLGQRYETTGSQNDLTRAVELLTEAVQATPSASPDRPQRLVDLAITLLDRHAALGNPDDLSVAVRRCSEAVRTIPPASPDRPACLAQYSLACYRRYASTGLLDDLDQAVAGLDEAIRTAQPNEFSVPGWWVNLATVLFVRSRRTLHGAVALTDDVLGQAELVRRRRRRVPPPQSGFAGFRFPREVIVLAVRWYLRYGLSYRDAEELLAERGITVDHVTIYRWVQRFTPLVIDAARPCRHAPGDRWFADETYVKVAGRWVYLYRAIDQFGQVIDVLVSQKRDLAATCRFFTRALQHGSQPAEVTTDRAQAYPRALDELVPAACHVMKKYANNPIESDHGRLKSRLRPMRGLKRLRCARVISAGHAFVQNIRRGHYELGTEEGANLRVLTAFTELTQAI